MEVGFEAGGGLDGLSSILTEEMLNLGVAMAGDRERF